MEKDKIMKYVAFNWKYYGLWSTSLNINPLPLLFKALLQGQKDCIFFSGRLIYILKQERFRAFWPAWDI
jgi:hypothetical protein